MTIAVDSHVHLLPERIQREPLLIGEHDPWFAACHAGNKPITTTDELLRYMDREEIETTVVYSWPFLKAEHCREANDFVADVVSRQPERLVGCGIVQPNSAEALQEIERCAQMGLRGIGELNCDAQEFSAESSALPELAARSVQLDLFWTLHCSEPVGHDYPGKGTATPDRIVKLIEKCPGLTVICAHLGGGLPFYAQMPEIANLCSDLWFDIAAVPFLYKASVLNQVIAAVGSDRILFGSDFPLLPRSRYCEMVEMTEESVQNAIWQGNARRLLAR